MLKVDSLQVTYSGALALRGVSFEVGEEEIVALIGANGAGKTTTLKAISRLVKAHSGTIRWNGKDLSTVSPYHVISEGISHCREGRQLFADMTMLENLLMGAYSLSNRKTVKDNLDWVVSIFPEIENRMDQVAGTLSGGEQQMVAVMRALIVRPKLLLLDEPSLGLSPIATKRVLSALPELKKSGTSILIVEQNAFQALQYSDRAYIIEVGDIVMEGKSSDLLEDEKLQEVYLGGMKT